MTTLGTPLSPSATRVMLLGSGELGKEVLIALQRLGVETIAVDRYENAPGQQVDLLGVQLEPRRDLVPHLVGDLGVAPHRQLLRGVVRHAARCTGVWDEAPSGSRRPI